MKTYTLSEEEQKAVLRFVTKLLATPGVQVSASRGIREAPGDDPWVHLEPGNSFCITISGELPLNAQREAGL